MPDILPLLKRAGAALREGKFADALAACEAALELQPGSPDAFYMMGVAHAGERRLDEAVSSFDAALAARPDFVQVGAQKARALVEMNRRVEAARACEATIRQGPRDPYTLDTLGVVLSRLGRHAEAADYFECAARQGKSAGNFYNLGAAKQFLGAFDEARAAYRTCLQRAPQHGRAWSGLVQITQQTAEENEISRLEDMFERVKDHPDGRLEVGHALAKAHEDLGRPTEAMAWLAQAKHLAAGEAARTAEIDDQLFAAAHRMLDLKPARDASAAAPLFVCGLPRTGTTIVERILSSHTDVASMGELSDFPIALNAGVGEPMKSLFDPDVMGRAAEADAAAVGRDYLSAVEGIFGVKGRFVDKLPFNFLLAPLILSALPNARVLVLRRNPADSVLANYRQIFARGAGYLDYTYDMERAARFYVGFDRLVTAYRERLPADRFREVSYEALVADIETEVRDLLAFCDLEFQQACVDFHENKTPVATASAAQARRPIYSSSVGRWKKCRPAIDPALRVLVEAGLMEESEAFG